MVGDGGNNAAAAGDGLPSPSYGVYMFGDTAAFGAKDCVVCVCVSVGVCCVAHLQQKHIHSRNVLRAVECLTDATSVAVVVVDGAIDSHLAAAVECSFTHRQTSGNRAPQTVSADANHGVPFFSYTM